MSTPIRAQRIAVDGRSLAGESQIVLTNEGRKILRNFLEMNR